MNQEGLSSCPEGMQLFMPKNKNDWEIVFKNLPGGFDQIFDDNNPMLVGISRTQNGCGGCTSFPMNSDVQNPGVRTWRVSGGGRWWGNPMSTVQNYKWWLNDGWEADVPENSLPRWPSSQKAYCFLKIMPNSTIALPGTVLPSIQPGDCPTSSSYLCQRSLVASTGVDTPDECTDAVQNKATECTELRSYVSVSDCSGLKEAFFQACKCGVEYTSSGSLASVVSASDCPGLKKAYKECGECS